MNRVGVSHTLGASYRPVSCADEPAFKHTAVFSVLILVVFFTHIRRS